MAAPDAKLAKAGAAAAAAAAAAADAEPSDMPADGDLDEDEELSGDDAADVYAFQGKERAELVQLHKKVRAQLNKPSVNAVAFINEIFPTPPTARNVQEVAMRVKRSVHALDEEIRQAVRAQTQADGQGLEYIREAKRAVSELARKMADIQKKASDSERMVQEISRDIRSLDYAKKNLSESITMLKRLHMLSSAVAKLKGLRGRESYRDASQLLGAVTSLADHFNSYANIPRIRELQDSITAIKSELRGQILADFASIEEFVNAGTAHELAPACAVVDYLGDEMREKLLEHFLWKQFAPYLQTYRPNTPEWSLEAVGARFVWLKSRMKYIEADLKDVFPKAWRVAEKLALKFCEYTCDHLCKILEESQMSLNVPEFLKVVQTTTDVEAQLARHFVVKRVLRPESGPASPVGGADASASTEGLSAADIVKARFERFKRERERKIQAIAATATPSVVEEDNELFKGVISRAFGPYMQHYIDVEETKLREMMDKFRADNAWYPGDEFSKVLTSAADLVVYYRRSLQRCVAISNAQPFFNLYKVHKRSAVDYCRALVEQLPKGPQLTAVDGHGLETMHVELYSSSVTSVMNIVDTALYFQEALKDLEALFKKRILDIYCEAVDFEDECREFSVLVAKAVLVLCLGTLTRIDTPMRIMLELPWSEPAMPPGLRYLADTERMLAEDLALYREGLSKVHFQRLCDRMATLFVPRYLSFVLRIRAISDAGIDQLLFDSGSVAAILMKLPTLGAVAEPGDEGGAGAVVPKTYARIVKREVAVLEALMKVVGTADVSAMAALYAALLPETGTSAQLRAVLEMKGLKPKEINAGVAAYEAAVTAAGGDPGAGSAGGGGDDTTGRTTSEGGASGRAKVAMQSASSMVKRKMISAVNMTRIWGKGGSGSSERAGTPGYDE